MHSHIVMTFSACPCLLDSLLWKQSEAGARRSFLSDDIVVLCLI